MSPPEDPNFDEPWQATLYALVHALADKGLFRWREWSEALGRNLREMPQAGNPAYYGAYLKTLEEFVTARGAASADELAALKEDWRASYESTPHGSPVVLQRT